MIFSVLKSCKNVSFLLTPKDFGLLLSSTTKNTSLMVLSDSAFGAMITSKVTMRSGPKFFPSLILKLWRDSKIHHICSDSGLTLWDILYFGCCSANFGPRLPMNQLSNNKICPKVSDLV